MKEEIARGQLWIVKNPADIKTHGHNVIILDVLKDLCYSGVYYDIKMLIDGEKVVDFRFFDTAINFYRFYRRIS